MEEKGIVDLFQKVAGYRVSRFCVQLENVLCPPMPRRDEDALYVENPLRTGEGAFGPTNIIWISFPLIFWHRNVLHVRADDHLEDRVQRCTWVGDVRCMFISLAFPCPL